MRSLTLTLTAAMVLTVAAACAPDDDADTRGASETTTTTTTTTEIPDTTAETEAADCDALIEEWLDAPVGSGEETEIEAQLDEGGCDVPGFTTDETLNLEGTITIDQAGDIATADMDLDEFCQTAEQLGDELAFTGWSAGFDGAAEQFGFSDREIFDEVMSRCS